MVFRVLVCIPSSPEDINQFQVPRPSMATCKGGAKQDCWAMLRLLVHLTVGKATAFGEVIPILLLLALLSAQAGVLCGG